mmetsp:Transcript_4235/g.3980  ORF Transcript_4235/g.3980 Transcript_4235/m.3980 type:complete len:118 (-) Transcript_4235:428-781(-)|eukprot:CAMPEP_0197003160 /NCGR_PEP_ID=MMETSP1380-20130617/7510_1 /TAXON_ID=5936 /ORGANISM="Euplotes crassus, Strain CT5" /LENGTH=117 /DNA_ID=CAMNT_0042421583 /DNA_START=70 /DNA_END=423 /DNA_ORIENTATION=+
MKGFMTTSFLNKAFVDGFDKEVVEKKKGKTKTDKMLEKLHFDLEYVKNVFRIQRIRGSFMSNALSNSPKRVRRKSRRTKGFKSHQDLNLTSRKEKSLLQSQKELEEEDEDNNKKRLK